MASVHSFEAIGTRWHIEFECTKEQEGDLIARVHERIAQFDKNYSRFRKDSMVTAMSRKAGVYELPADAQPMFDLYRDLYVLTDGALTPLIGDVLSDAGYDATYSLQAKKLTSPPAWDEALVYNYPSLTLKQPVLLDFGAAGKGYLVDIVADLLAEAGVDSFLVDAGGDIRSWSKKSVEVHIGLEDPDDTSQVIGVAHISNTSICGSAGNRRTWAQFHHIIHPDTLSSPKDLAAVWVVAQGTMLADALATALYFVPASVLNRRYTFEYLKLLSDRSIEKSGGFPAEVFTTETP